MTRSVTESQGSEEFSREMQVNLNRDEVLDHLEALSSNQGSMYVHVGTGALRYIPRSDFKPVDWTVVKLDLSANQIEFDVPSSEGRVQKTARSVLKATSKALNTHCDKIKQDHGLDHFPTLAETQEILKQTKIEQMFEKMSLHDDRLQLASDEIETIRCCFANSLEGLDGIGSLEELAKVLTACARERLEAFEPLEQEEIKAIYNVLNMEQVKAYYELDASNEYHPTVVFKYLYEAVIAFEADPDKAKVSTAPGGEFLGVNGSYFLQNQQGERLWIFKPANEEKEGMMAGVPAGQGAKREHIACLLNHHMGYGIPYTAYVRIGGQEGSAQRFVQNCKGIINLQTMPDKAGILPRLTAASLQASLVFDMRFNNWDRHMGNLMFRLSADDLNVVMIDHGCILSTSVDDMPKFEQLSMPQMHAEMDHSLEVLFSEETERKDVEILRKHQIPEEAIARMKNATLVFRQAYEISATMRMSGRPEVGCYDVGLLVLKQSELLWSEAGVSKMQSQLEEVVPAKEAVVAHKVPLRRAKSMQKRNAMARDKGESIFLKLMYGSDQNDQIQEISWEQSILGSCANNKKV